MRLNSLAVLALGPVAVLADVFTVLTTCNALDCNSEYGLFTTAYSSFKVDARKGCRNPGVEGVNLLCMD